MNTPSNLAQAEHVNDKRVDDIIAMLLRAGVLLAAAVILAGGILYLRRHGSYATNYRIFHGEPGNLSHVHAIVQYAFGLDPRGIIQFGLLLLIATPVARVLFTVFAFAYERDWTYVAITVIVLGLLLYSLGAWHL